MSKIIGIDVSKQTFDICFSYEGEWIHKSFSNNPKGFKEFAELVTLSDMIVMEATGSYYLPLAKHFFSMGCKVVVENPLVIKRFSQSKLRRAKTDKADSKLIAEYAHIYENSLKPWDLEDEQIIQLRQIHTRIELLNKQINQNTNQLEAFESSGSLTVDLKKEINKMIKQLKVSKEKLEKEMQSLVKNNYKETYDNLLSIPGIGPKTATMLIVITGNFKKFNNHKQLIAYIGFSPRIYQSGTSIQGRGSICKMGKSQIRKLLYLCSWSAKRYNPQCVEMYNRLEAKNKPERVIKIAIANKLVRQVFAIAIKNEKYQKNYTQNIVI